MNTAEVDGARGFRQVRFVGKLPSKKAEEIAGSAFSLSSRPRDCGARNLLFFSFPSRSATLRHIPVEIYTRNKLEKERDERTRRSSYRLETLAIIHKIL